MPISIKTRPKFRCDFCRYAATLPAVEKHEKVCWKNPDRFCDLCKNTGAYELDGYGDPPFGIQQYAECPYCKKFDPDLAAL